MRLQFHKGFTFDDARALTPYLVRLGISHVCSSSILTARPGSLHGYDVIDPTKINPEMAGKSASAHWWRTSVMQDWV
jgi:(1->4)-alpha-D-glucan 1-alpha-D-glucosylmutase